MVVNLLKEVTVNCDNCGTSIKFNIPANNKEMYNLSDLLEDLECPRCKESLSYTTTEPLKAIYEYNNAAQKLNSVIESNNISIK